MASERNVISDERIGEALIRMVIQENLRDVPSENTPSLNPLAVEGQTVQEIRLVTQLGTMTRFIGDGLRRHQELADMIDEVVRCPGPKMDKFVKLAEKMFEHGITWERISMFIYVSGRLAARMVEADLPDLVRRVLFWTMDFFRRNLLGWIREHGGWINSFSDLMTASMQNVSSLSSHSFGLIIFFIAGLTLGTLITWRLTRQH